MRYPIAIEPGTAKTAYGVVVPDLPGCFSAGDTLDEAMANTPEAIASWLEVTLERGESVPKPGTLEKHRRNSDYKGWIWAVVDVDLSQIDDRQENIKVTLPRRLLARVDARAKRSGESRSGFLARAALDALGQSQ